PAPPPPPPWRNWLIVAGLIATALALCAHRMKAGPAVQTLTYSRFIADVQAGQVKTVTIEPSGAVTGILENGTHYKTQIPVALQDTGLAQLLQSNGVQITALPASTGSLGSVILSFLPLLLFVGVFVYLGRRAGRQMAGGLSSITGSRATLYDSERPPTRFADVAGYEGAKREVAEVVDFLKKPTRYSRAGAVGPEGVIMVGPPGAGR